MFNDTQTRLIHDATTQAAIAASRTHVDWRREHPRDLYATQILHWPHTTTLHAASRLTAMTQGKATVCALNFASARHPGGGVERGAPAQEESLCRASGLWPCLKNQPDMYLRNNHNPRQGLYASVGIFSPLVPVIKKDDGQLLAKAYLVNFLTIPAVNATEARRQGLTEATIQAAMLDRLDSVLSLALDQGQTHVVLGAYGCGVFGNDVHSVAAQWQRLLATKYRGCFATLVFATIKDEEHDALATIHV